MNYNARHGTRPVRDRANGSFATGASTPNGQGLLISTPRNVPIVCVVISLESVEIMNMMGERDGPVTYLMRIRLLLEEARVLSNWKFVPRGLQNHSRNAKVRRLRGVPSILTSTCRICTMEHDFPSVYRAMEAWVVHLSLR